MEYRNLGLLRQLIDLGISLDDIDVEVAFRALFQASLNICVKSIQDLNQVWEDDHLDTGWKN